MEVSPQKQYMVLCQLKSLASVIKKNDVVLWSETVTVKD